MKPEPRAVAGASQSGRAKRPSDTRRAEPETAAATSKRPAHWAAEMPLATSLANSPATLESVWASVAVQPGDRVRCE